MRMRILSSFTSNEAEGVKGQGVWIGTNEAGRWCVGWDKGNWVILQKTLWDMAG